MLVEGNQQQLLPPKVSGGVRLGVLCVRVVREKASPIGLVASCDGVSTSFPYKFAVRGMRK